MGYGVFVLAHARPRRGVGGRGALVGNVDAEGHVGAAEVELQDLGARRLESARPFLPSVDIDAVVGKVGDDHQFPATLACRFDEPQAAFHIQPVFGREDVELLLLEPPVTGIVIDVGPRIEGLLCGGRPPSALLDLLQLFDALDGRPGADDKGVAERHIADCDRQLKKVLFHGFSPS